MPHNETIVLTGVVEHVFAHRFTIAADDQVHLADLTPKGLAAFPIGIGLSVTLEGERRPSEIKVTRISADGCGPVEIEHNKPHHAPGHKHADGPADPAVALAAVRDAGWSVIDEPRRRPKHFEVLAHRSGGEPVELHVDFAGAIYKEKAADPAKWSIAV